MYRSNIVTFLAISLAILSLVGLATFVKIYESNENISCINNSKFSVGDVIYDVTDKSGNRSGVISEIRKSAIHLNQCIYLVYVRGQYISIPFVAARKVQNDVRIS